MMVNKTGKVRTNITWGVFV